MRKMVRILTGCSLAMVFFLAGGGVMRAVSANADYDSLMRFSQVLDMVEQYYVKDVNQKDLIDGALKGMLQGLDQTDYGRYRDTVYDWQNTRDYLAGRYDNERNFDFGMYQTNLGSYENDRNFALQQQNAAQAQNNWLAEMAYGAGIDERAWQYQLQQDALARTSGGGVGGGGGSTPKTTPTNSSANTNREGPYYDTAEQLLVSAGNNQAARWAMLTDMVNSGKISEWERDRLYRGVV